MSENNTQTTTETAVAPVEKKLSLVQSMAIRYAMEPRPFLDAVKQTVFPNAGQGISDSQVAAFLVVANEHGLNPFLREIHAFPTKSGGIMPVMGIDGWLKIANSHPMYDGMDKPVFEYQDGKLFSCTLTLYRKDRNHPTVHTEFFSEAYRNTEPWNRQGHRMLLNRTGCQIIRWGFGLAGIMDEDEAMALDITAESTVLERSTETRTERLKEKIGAKKVTAPKEQPVLPAEQPAVSAEPTLTAQQRQAFLDALIARAGEIGATEIEAREQGKAIISRFGVDHSSKILQAQHQDLLNQVAAWTKAS